ncbi:MAG: hypothetical protein WA790_07005 [Sulfitobacter sp.]
MSNVISLRDHQPVSLPTGHARLIASFAEHRRQPDDVYWLKENAELLGILSATGTILTSGSLAPFDAFYAQIEARVQFFPQYYRFLISLCLDLEDLGMPGNKGAALCHWADTAGLVEAELSDLQRAEARRLLARRGVVCQQHDALTARLYEFAERSETFAMPNKKAAYELTHIVFYLSEYGACDPQLSKQAVTSLEYVGLLAYLDQNVDLLAEVCVALRFAGQVPSAIWEAAVRSAHVNCAITEDAGGELHDGYHAYLVTGWAMQIAGDEAFGGNIPEGSLRFSHGAGSTSALRTMSERMFEMGQTRSDDWQQMRAHVAPYLGTDGHDVLASAEQSTDKFEAFFAGCARAGGS